MGRVERGGVGEYLATEYLGPAESIVFFILQTTQDELFAHFADADVVGELHWHCFGQVGQVGHALHIPGGLAEQHFIVDQS